MLKYPLKYTFCLFLNDKYSDNGRLAIYTILLIASVIHVIYYLDEKSFIKTLLAVIASIIVLILFTRQVKKDFGE